MRLMESKSHVKHTAIICSFITIKPTQGIKFFIFKACLLCLASISTNSGVENIYLLCAGNIPDADAWAATCWEATRAAEVKPSGKKTQGFHDVKSTEPVAVIRAFLTVHVKCFTWLGQTANHPV